MRIVKNDIYELDLVHQELLTRKVRIQDKDEHQLMMNHSQQQEQDSVCDSHNDKTAE